MLTDSSQQYASAIKQLVQECDEQAFLSGKNSFLMELVQYGLRYAWSHGLGFIRNPPSLDSISLIPFSLLPHLMLKKLFDEARNVTVLYSQLVESLSMTRAWHRFMENCFLQNSTELISRLMEIARKCYGEEDYQRNLLYDINFNIMRSDYLLKESDHGTQLALVEINTIAASYASISSQLESYYRASIKKLFKREQPTSLEILPNPCLKNIVHAFEKVHQLYLSRMSSFPEISVPLNPGILFVVNNKEENQLDQFLIEAELMEISIPTLRKSFEDLKNMVGQTSKEGHPLLSQLKKNSKTLQPIKNLYSPCSTGRLILYDSNVYWEITIIYFRVGYDIEHFSSDTIAFWKIREILEFSDAVKCPNVYSQLTGVKKMQSKWLDNIHLSSLNLHVVPPQLKNVAVDHVNLCDYHTHAATKQLVDEAIRNPSNFVLKPQQEGGSSMLYGKHIVSFLEACKVTAHHQYSDVATYSLMRLINSAPHSSLYFSSTQKVWAKKNTVSELGIFTTGIHDQLTGIHETTYAGYLLRTKERDNPCGGVSVGAAMLNYPLLYSENS